MDFEHVFENDVWRIEVYFDMSADSPRSWYNLGYVRTSDTRSAGQIWEDVPEDEEIILQLPVYLYSHSGVTISTHPFSCTWDSWQWGEIATTKERVAEQMGKEYPISENLESLADQLRAEIQILDQYLQGDVHGVTVYKCGELYDSCSGFYGADWKEFVEEVVGQSDQLSFDWYDTPESRLLEEVSRC